MSRPLEELARAILDGEPVDWSSVDIADAGGDRVLVDQLKTLAAVRRVTRPAPPTDAPASWGHLRVLEPIGRGAFGTVHRAWDPRLDREVALKFLEVESRHADAHATEVIEEGRLLARVKHPNVVTIFGADRIAGRVGLWMELVTGQTLAAAWRGRPGPSPREVARLGVELCRAVAAVHAAGLLHRDIKAHNVMLAADARLVLMDLGASHPLDAATRHDATGTPLYLAPEILAGGSASLRSDVYSIGVVLYYLLTGTYPVQGVDVDALRRAHAARAKGPPPFAGRAVPRRLRAVVARAIAHDPARRFASAAEMADALAATTRRSAAIRLAYAGVTAVVAASLALLVATPSQGLPGLARGTPAVVDGTAARDAAIAVLPFANLSPEPDSDYFVDGLTAEVIHDLAQLDGLQVRSQTSSFAFRTAPRDLSDIGRRLGVDYVVEADVLRVGDRLRLNARLVATADDTPLWSERFDRTVDDVFAIQDEISRAIVNKLRLTLNRGQRRYRTTGPTYDTYLRARTLLTRGGTNNAQRAKPLFEAVIAADPGFAPAHAGLADAYAEMSAQLDGLSPEEGLRGMRPSAARALELDPLLAEAHAAMGITYARELEWDRAATAFEQALALQPSLTQIHANYVLSTLIPTAQTAKARQVLMTALVADPLSATLRSELGLAEYCDGRFDDAIASFRLALAADPTLPFTRRPLALALTAAGRYDEAIATWHERPASEAGWERWLTRAYVLAGRTTDVERLVAADRDGHPLRQAVVFAGLGDRDRAFAALAAAARLTPGRTGMLLACPEMALLRGDPRLAAVRRQLNLP